MGMNDHDDFGGLQRDLLATGAAMDRRGLFRMAAKFGGAVGAFQLLGCGGTPTQPGGTTTTTTTTTTTPATGSCSRANRAATSQIALPKATCDLVYATPGYESSVTNLRQVTLASDMVFSDGSSLELATVSGSVAGGFVASLTVGV
jgi:hypothetical protein